jgi:multisubunit Na+/H+ antiporter MnhG subunit
MCKGGHDAQGDGKVETLSKRTCLLCVAVGTLENMGIGFGTFVIVDAVRLVLQNPFTNVLVTNAAHTERKPILGDDA